MFARVVPKNITLLLSVILLLTMSACLRSPAKKAIPEDVFFATRANILRATYQVPDWKDILKEEYSIDIEADSLPKANFFASPKAYIFGDLLQGDDNYIAFALYIRNVKSLEKFVTDMNPDLKVHKDSHGKFKYLIKNKSLLAWSHNLLILLDARQAPTQDKIIETFQKIAHLEPEHSLYKQNQNFRQALSRRNHRYDVVSWIDTEEIVHSPLLNTFAQNVNLQENYLHIYSNFDEGMISIQTEYFTNRAFYESYARLLSQPLGTEILHHIPVENPAVVIGLSIDPHALPTLLGDIEWTGKVKNVVETLTLTLEQFLDMLNGDMVLVLRDVRNLEKGLVRVDSSQTLPNENLSSDLMFGIGLNNLAIYDSLKQVLLETNMMTKEEGYYKFFSEYYVLETDSLLYFTKSETIKDDFIQGISCQNETIVHLADNHDSWLLLYADENIAENTLKGKDLLKTVARNILKNEDVQLDYATFLLSTIEEEAKDKNSYSLIEEGHSVVILRDVHANSILAMIEVLKEIIVQTKTRLDPNYYDGAE